MQCTTTGIYTLKDRIVQFHGPKHVPSDAEAVLEWGLDTPFSSQDKPPLAIAMVVIVNGVRSLKRFRLVIAQKSKLRLTQEVTAALASHSRDHRLTARSFFPCSIDREYLYGYAGDGYRSPLWLCASHNGSPVLVHRLKGSKMYFHQATKDRRIVLIPGIHYFDAHRLQPLLLQAPALQVHMRESSLVGPEGAGEQVDDPSSDEEQSTTASETEAESEDDDEARPPEEPWCPPIPPAMDDPTEQEIKGAADKLATMISSSQPSASVFFHPDNLGALPHLWLQAKLTISLTSMQEKFARLFMSIASELWLRGVIGMVEEVFAHAARSFTLRLAEKLSQYICSLTRRAESLATPETECLLYATFWFRPILSELIVAARESAEVNRKRAPSGPVKVVVTNQPHSRRHTGVDLVSGTTALLAWFPASWASKIAPCFVGEAGGSTQAPQEISFSCPHRVFEGLQRDAADQVLQAVRFTDKNAPGLSLALDEEFQAADCFSELARGYTQGVVDPSILMGLQPTGPTRVNLEIIVPSAKGLTPEMWKQTATLCPLDWPSNYSLLRLWHTPKSFHQYAAQLKQQVQHQHMFTHWEVNRAKLASRVLFPRPAHYLSEQTLQQHMRERVFPDRKLRKRVPQNDVAAFNAKCNEVCRLAAMSEAANPVPFAIGNSWNDTLRAGKRHHLEYTTRSQT